MAGGFWPGTELTLPGLGAVGSLLVGVALLCLRSFLAVSLLSHKLPLRRAPWALPAALAAVLLAWVSASLGLMAAATIGAASPPAGYLVQLATFSVLLVILLGGLLLLCDTSVWTALFCVTAGYTVQNLASGATELVASCLREAGANPGTPAVYLLNDALCMAAVLGACHVLLARRLNREGLMQIESHQMLLMMPVVSLAIIGLDVVIKSLTGGGLALGYVVVLRLFHALACVATLWIEYQMLYRGRIERERQTAERLLSERERQYRLSRETIDAINVKCHDLRHQIRSLASGGAAVSGEALDDLAREVSIYDCAVTTGNEALDTILTEKSLLCERQGITFTRLADGGALGFMAPADIYALFGNALDNAIEAASELEDAASRSITLTVRRTLGCASVHVENYFAGERAFEDGLPLTTKADRLNHGFGTRSMRQIAERYGGTLTAEADGNAFCLDVMVPLPSEGERDRGALNG